MKHCTTDKCPQILDSSCVFYEGPTLLFSGINTNDSLELIIQKLNLKLESIPALNLNNYYNKPEINNIIKGYIPLSGTLINYPVMGNIEFSPGNNVKLYSNDSSVMLDDGSVNIDGNYITISSINNNNSVLVNNSQVFLNSGNFNNRKFINLSQESNYIALQSNVDGAGLVGQNYYGNNYVDNSFVQKKFVVDTFNNIDLSNYYTKNETYSKTEVDDIISDIPVVDTSNLVPYDNATKDVNIASNYFKTSKGFDYTFDGNNYFRTFHNELYNQFEFSSNSSEFGGLKINSNVEEGFSIDRIDGLNRINVGISSSGMQFFADLNNENKNIFSISQLDTYSKQPYVTDSGFRIINGTPNLSLTADGGTFDLNEKADLVDGKVPSSQLPSYVDDVLEFANLASFPATGENGKIYIALDTNKTYRWSGSVYVIISESLALGETSSTAYRGDRGKIAYDHSQVTHDKTLVGLGNVDNTSDLDKPISTATQNALVDGLATKLSKGTYTGTASDLVPYTGATQDVDLGANSLRADGGFVSSWGDDGILRLARPYDGITKEFVFGGGKADYTLEDQSCSIYATSEEGVYLSMYGKSNGNPIINNLVVSIDGIYISSNDETLENNFFAIKPNGTFTDKKVLTNEGFDFTFDENNYFKTYRSDYYSTLEFKSKDSSDDNFGYLQITANAEEGFNVDCVDGNGANANSLQVNINGTSSPKAFVSGVGFKTPFGTATQALTADGGIFDLNLKLSTEAPSTTGTVISFSTDKVYGTLATPETGNITADITNAKLGVTNIIIHNSGTAPTFGSTFKKLSGSGNYVTGVVNYIYCTYISTTEIIYSINQRT